jgi:hypothetical protein
MQNQKITQANKLVAGGMSMDEADRAAGIQYTDTGRTDSDGWPIVEIDGAEYRRIDADGADCGYDNMVK